MTNDIMEDVKIFKREIGKYKGKSGDKKAEEYFKNNPDEPIYFDHESGDLYVKEDVWKDLKEFLLDEGE